MVIKMGSNSLKRTFTTIALTLITISFITTVVSSSPKDANLETIQTSQTSMVTLPEVYIYPSSIVGLRPGDNFTISVIISNLTDTRIIDPTTGVPYWLGDLYGLDIALQWDPTILDYISHSVLIPIEVYPRGILHEPTTVFIDKIDEAAGTYHIAAYSLPPAEPFNNPNQTNIVFNMTFTLLRSEITTIHFINLTSLDYQNLKCVQLATDTTGKECAPFIPNIVNPCIIGKDLEVTDISLSSLMVTEGYNISIDLTLSNYGGKAENISVTLYYNKTEITDWENLETAQWEPIGTVNITLPQASYDHANQIFKVANKTLTFTWNTKNVLEGLLHASFYIMANITMFPDEIDTQNNRLLSKEPIKVTSAIYKDLLISDFNATIKDKFKLPALSGEVVDVRFAILNNGTIPEENITVTLTIIGPNCSITENYNISSLDPSQKYFIKYIWDTSHLAGNYDLKIQVSEVSNENDTTNNIYTETLTVILPPTLQVTISKTKVKVGETIICNATLSRSNAPNETIEDWRWEWKVYEVDIKPENLIYTYTEGPIMNYTIQKYAPYYRIVLTITDSYNLTYLYPERPLTNSYRLVKTVYVEKAVPEKKFGLPLTYIGIIITIAIIIAVAIYYLKVKKER